MRTRTAWTGATLLLVGFSVATTARADSTLYSFGPDGNGVGRVLTPVAPAGGGVAIGDGASAFNGGLAWIASTSTMVAIENDSSGNSSLTSFSLASPTTLAAPVALGQGFLGGLAYDGTNSTLYAVGTDTSGNSTLYAVDGSGATALGSLGVAFQGGLTYDAHDDKLYAIGADDNFQQDRVFQIDLGGGSPAVTALFDLGDESIAFNGGLAWDATADAFSVIGNDSSGDSSLYSFSLGGAGAFTDLGGIGAGFVNAGLAYSDAAAPPPPPPPSIPEPPAVVLLALGGFALLARARLQSRESASSLNPSESC